MKIHTLRTDDYVKRRRPEQEKERSTKQQEEFKVKLGPTVRLWIPYYAREDFDDECSFA